ncbi:PstS family phosphate ABC transporter substrate-binding protein [Paenibacillus camelliae]|uniref:PstS family phosphate ABC transporter substrate-binding protein n=1 Tax=Paenibacillus camelliae TaxID=512410 RepID=UPI0032E80237
MVILKSKTIKGFATLVMAAVLVFTAACGNNNNKEANQPSNSNAPAATNSANAPTESTEPEVKLSGEIKIDGSSTVFPVTEAVAEEFRKVHPDVRVPVGVSGTGGGMKQFTAGEIPIANASRPMKDSEAEAAKAAGIEFTQIDVAYDGLSVVVSQQNDFIDHLTVEELTKIFSVEGNAVNWSDIRAEWPSEPIVIFSPGADSGTYDYFAEVVLEDANMKTEGVTFSEDDNTLVTGVAGTPNGIGYFGYAYYEENQDTLKAVPIDGGNGAVAPTFDTIKDGSYTPLSRELYFYVNNAEMARPEVAEFVKFYIENASELAGEVGYVGMPQEAYDEQLAKIDALK